MDDSINANTSLMQKTFQKHFGGVLFLSAILLVTGGQIITTLFDANIAYYGSIGVIPLTVLIPQTVALFIIFFESRFRNNLKHSQRVLKFFKVTTIVIIVLLCLRIPIAIHTMRTGGNWVALGAFYTLVYSIPNILFFIAFLRVVSSMIKRLKQNEQEKIAGVLMISICGSIYAFLEFLQVSLFVSFVREALFNIVWRTHGWGDFGLYSTQWSVFSFIYLAGAILFMVVLNKFNREVKTHKKSDI